MILAKLNETVSIDSCIYQLSETCNFGAFKQVVGIQFMPTGFSGIEDTASYGRAHAGNRIKIIA